MRFRRCISICIGVVALSALAASAHAGGNWIEVNGRYFVVGEEIVVKNRYFNEADVAHGPYFAYLLANDVRWNSPPHFFDGALVLGRVRILWPPDEGWTNRPMPQNPLLIGRFEMPRVTPGKYYVAVCNRPCTQRIEWIGPSMVQVVQTAAVGRLHERIDSLQYRIDTLEDRDRRSERRARVEMTKRFRDELDDLRTRLTAARRQPEPSSPAPIWIGLGLGVAALSLLSLVIALRSRRQANVDWDLLLDASEHHEPITTNVDVARR
jgi:hypothetical protein